MQVCDARGKAKDQDSIPEKSIYNPSVRCHGTYGNDQFSIPEKSIYNPSL